LIASRKSQKGIGHKEEQKSLLIRNTREEKKPLPSSNKPLPRLKEHPERDTSELPKVGSPPDGQKKRLWKKTQQLLANAGPLGKKEFKKGYLGKTKMR